MGMQPWYGEKNIQSDVKGIREVQGQSARLQLDDVERRRMKLGEKYPGSKKDCKGDAEEQSVQVTGKGS
jgi:hypothetical protein